MVSNYFIQFEVIWETVPGFYLRSLYSCHHFRDHRHLVSVLGLSTYVSKLILPLYLQKDSYHGVQISSIRLTRNLLLQLCFLGASLGSLQK